MKRLAILIVSAFSLAGVAMAEPAPGNQDLYGSILYKKEAAPARAISDVENQDLYGWVVYDEQFLADAEETTTRPLGYGDSYGNILLDVGIDPWGVEE